MPMGAKLAPSVSDLPSCRMSERKSFSFHYKSKFHLFPCIFRGFRGRRGGARWEKWKGVGRGPPPTASLFPCSATQSCGLDRQGRATCARLAMLHCRPNQGSRVALGCRVRTPAQCTGQVASPPWAQQSLLGLWCIDCRNRVSA